MIGYAYSIKDGPHRLSWPFPSLPMPLIHIFTVSFLARVQTRFDGAVEGNVTEWLPRLIPD